MKKETNSETRTCDQCGKEEVFNQKSYGAIYFHNWYTLTKETKYPTTHIIGEDEPLDWGQGLDFCSDLCLCRFATGRLDKANKMPLEEEPFPRAVSLVHPEALPTPYAWLITKDHVADKEAPPTTNYNALGAVGPCGITQDQIDLLVDIRLGVSADDSTIEFRMYDDDDNLYYEGILIGEYNELEPLDDFGMLNAGCTRIDTYNIKTGNWETV